MTFAVGLRVKVHQDPDYGPGPWPAEPFGRIVAHPDGAPYQSVETRTGPQRMWWVLFDEPQYDADGDGPYTQSQVSERYSASSNDTPHGLRCAHHSRQLRMSGVEFLFR